MQNKLLKKLQVKPGYRLRAWNAPRNLAAILGDVPEEIQIEENGKGPVDAALVFAADSTEMQRELKAALRSLRPDTVTWVAYPKKSSGRQTDLNLMSYWQPELLHGLEPCASVSIDDTWTGIRLRPAGQSKPSGMCNDDIAAGEWAQYIDVKARQILKLPSILTDAFSAEPSAEAAFSKLAYSHKKEYLLWILSAKQDKTRTARTEKTIAMLLAGKKNPADK